MKDAPPEPISLDRLPESLWATVTEVSMPADPAQRALALRLLELGFIPGERVRVVHAGMPGREPIAVRLGHATFALRRNEAAIIHVVLD